jgi:cytochrome c oxidase assembly protein subunit 15
MRKGHVISWITAASLLTMGVQIILGTQVREAIDVVASDLAFALRETWVSRLGAEFFIHRSFSLLILLIHGVLFYLILKNAEKTHTVRKAVMYLLILVVVEIVSGMAMAYVGIPAFIQPVHLLLSTVLFGLLYYVFLQIQYSNNKSAIS